MDSGHIALLTLDLLGTLAFAVNGAMTALKFARVDIVGVLTLGMVTALGGGFIRDILIDSLPPRPSWIGDTCSSRLWARSSHSF